MQWIARFSFMLLFTLTIGITGVRAGNHKLNIEWKQVSSIEADTFTWSPDSQDIAFFGLGLQKTYVINAHTGVGLWSIDLPEYTNDDSSDDDIPTSIRWSPDSSYLAVGVEGIAYLLDAQSGNLLDTYTIPSDLEPRKQKIVDLEWSKDSLTLAAFSNLGYLHPFDIKTHKIVRTILFLSEDFRINSGIFDWSSDNRLFASPFLTTEKTTTGPNLTRIDIHTTIGVWDKDGNRIDDDGEQTDHQCRVIGQMETMHGLRWSPNSRQLAVGTSYGMTICSLNNSNKMQTRLISKLRSYSPSWSPDGRWLVTSHGTDPNDCEIDIFDTFMNFSLTRIRDSEICSTAVIDWSPSGKQIASISNDQLWVGTVSDN